MKQVMLIGPEHPGLNTTTTVLEALCVRPTLLPASPPLRPHAGEWDLLILDDGLVDRCRLRVTVPLDTPVLVLTAERASTDRSMPSERRVEVLALNADPATTLDLLRDLLDLSPPEALQVGPLRLDLLLRKVEHRWRRLTVSATEFRILRTLMQVPGRHLDCETLARLSNCKTVTPHLRSLRRKLAVYAAGSLLRGTPTNGYAIDARASPRHAADTAMSLKRHLQHL